MSITLIPLASRSLRKRRFESVWDRGGKGAQRSHILLGACSFHLGRGMFPLGLLQILFGHQSFLN